MKWRHGAAGSIEDAALNEKSGGEKVLSDAAKRALAEAEERRRAQAAEERPKELGGRAGPDPVRHGDWENKGIASDF